MCRAGFREFPVCKDSFRNFPLLTKGNNLAPALMHNDAVQTLPFGHAFCGRARVVLFIRGVLPGA